MGTSLDQVNAQREAERRARDPQYRYIKGREEDIAAERDRQVTAQGNVFANDPNNPVNVAARLREQQAAISGVIGTEATAAAKRAGTYAPTPEFAKGLGAETAAETRGAGGAIQSRLDALGKFYDVQGKTPYEREAYLKRRLAAGPFKDQGAVTGTPEAQLAGELKGYGGAEQTALQQAEAAAKRAGTYAPTREFQTTLEGETGAQARGIRATSLARINALKQRLGIPIAPGGTV